MNTIVIKSLLLLCLSVGVAAAQSGQRLFRWVDTDGVVHYGDSIPPEYSELERQVLNEHGITIDVMQAKKTAAQLAEERRLEELRLARELQARADQNLLATYMSVDEILLHRDRRVELFQAQARVTELYLKNLQRRMDSLRNEAANFRPYSVNPDAPIIDPELANDMTTTKETIVRHERNLQKFHEDELLIVARFDGDVDRFRRIKGLN